MGIIWVILELELNGMYSMMTKSHRLKITYCKVYGDTKDYQNVRTCSSTHSDYENVLLYHIIYHYHYYFI